MENRCVSCGEIIPEGRQVCWKCEHESHLRVPKKLDISECKGCQYWRSLSGYGGGKCCHYAVDNDMCREWDDDGHCLSRDAGKAKTVKDSMNELWRRLGADDDIR